MRGEHAPASISKMTIMKIKHMIAVSLLLLTGIRDGKCRRMANEARPHDDTLERNP